MMKHRLTLVALACAATVGLWAQPRSEREMQSIAAAHLFGTAARSTAAAPPSLQRLSATSMVAVYAAPSRGAVFVSRDAIFAPVLGWTDRPLLSDTLPPAVQWWLQTITATMQQKQADNVFTTMQAAQQATDVAPLVSSRWAQDAPYNDKCPVADSWAGTRSQTGCVATAMAQVMRYHRHPAQGSGMGYYTLNGSTARQKKRIQGVYDWAHMLDTYSSSAKKDETTDAVATLMYDCGLASGMAYARQGSGATSPNAARGMVHNLDYDSLALQCHFRAFANDAQWLADIYAELADGRPVLYMSTDANYGAHAFVVDGCRAADGYLHVNWGWNGDANGYFDFYNLTPITAYQQAYGMTGYDFSRDVQSQTAITGILPPDGQKRPYQSYWCMDGEETISVEGDSIVLQLPTLLNYHYLDFSGLVGLCIEDVKTGHAPIQPFYYTAWGEEPVPSLSGWQPMTVPYYRSVTDQLADGEYDLYLMSWHTTAIGKSNPQYIRFPARNDGSENFNVWRMTKRDGHLSISKRQLPVEDAIHSPSTRHLSPSNPHHVYDLQGRTAMPHHGLYIRDGRKYVIH